MYSMVSNGMLVLWLITMVIPICAEGGENESGGLFVTLPEGHWVIIRNMEMKRGDDILTTRMESERNERIRVKVTPNDKGGTVLVFEIVESKLEGVKGISPVNFEPFTFVVMKNGDGRISSIEISEGKSKKMLGHQLESARNLVLMAMPLLSSPSESEDMSEDKHEFKKFRPIRLECSDIPEGVWTKMGGASYKRVWPPPKEFIVINILEDDNIVFGASEFNANLQEWLIWRYVYDPDEQRIVEGEFCWYEFSGKLMHPLSINKVFRGFFNGKLKVGGYGGYYRMTVKISPAKEEPKTGEGEN